MHYGTLHLLILIVAANSAPVITARMMGRLANRPIDFGSHFIDKRRVLGDSKTWRGVCSAITAGTLLAIALDYPPATGAVVAGLAMIGDVISSFVKRRLQMASSTQAPLLDQIPESLLPAAVMKTAFELDWIDVVIVTAAFILVEVIFSKIFFRLGVRKRPY